MRVPACLVLSFVLTACDTAGAPADRDPTLLSSYGLYADIDEKTIVPGAQSFTPAYPLWSDGAEKRRYLILPPGTHVDTSDMDHWQFPVGTRFFKEFSRDGQRLETRMIERVADTGDQGQDFEYAVFVWRADQSDAVLTPGGATDIGGTGHDAPSTDMCTSCHTGEPGGILGYSAVQLATAPAPGDATEAAALGWLHGNCGHCHNDDGGIAPGPRFRLYRADAGKPAALVAAYLTTVNQPIESWAAPAAITMRIVAGDPDASGVVFRISHRGDGDQMPPLGTELVDDDGVAAVRAWIAAM